MKLTTLAITVVSVLAIFSCATTPETTIEAVNAPFESILPGDFPLIRVSTDGLSPNGDGLHDYIELFPESGRQDALVGWVVEIQSDDGPVVRRFSGGAPIPNSIAWDGTDDSNNVVPEGRYRARLAVSFEQDEVYEALTSSFQVSLSGPALSTGPVETLFTPDGDGENDQYSVDISAERPETIASWEIRIVDPTGTPFYVAAGIGPPPSSWTWDGRGPARELVQSASEYTATITATNVWENTSSSTWPIRIGILVMPEDDSYRIRVATIVFQPFTADFQNVGADERQANEDTLDQLAEIFERYADYDITLIGHAVQIYWGRPDLMNREQTDVLLPLSLQRSEAIRAAFIERGIAAGRMHAEGRGGAEPVVPHSDLNNRWKNRRVTFILNPRES